MVIWSFLNSCSSWPVGHWFSPKTSITSTKQWCWTPSSLGLCFSHKFYETPIASHRLTLTPLPTKKLQKTTDQQVSSNKSYSIQLSSKSSKSVMSKNLTHLLCCDKAASNLICIKVPVINLTILSVEEIPVKETVSRQERMRIYWRVQESFF